MRSRRRLSILDNEERTVLRTALYNRVREFDESESSNDASTPTRLGGDSAAADPTGFRQPTASLVSPQAPSRACHQRTGASELSRVGGHLKTLLLHGVELS